MLAGVSFIWSETTLFNLKKSPFSTRFLVAAIILGAWSQFSAFHVIIFQICSLLCPLYLHRLSIFFLPYYWYDFAASNLIALWLPLFSLRGFHHFLSDFLFILNRHVSAQSVLSCGLCFRHTQPVFNLSFDSLNQWRTQRTAIPVRTIRSGFRVLSDRASAYSVLLVGHHRTECSINCI